MSLNNFSLATDKTNLDSYSAIASELKLNAFSKRKLNYATTTT